MNKNVFKIGALVLGLFTFVAVLNNTLAAPGDVTGQLKLTINSGTTECRFDTSMDLLSQTAELNTALTFTGNFTGNGAGSWVCTDGQGGEGYNWSLSVASTDLHGSNGGTITNSNVYITHGTAVATGDTAACQSLGDGDETLSTSYTIMERPAGMGGIGIGTCGIYTPNVGLRVEVAANSTPGVYTGTLTVTANNITPNPY